MVWRFEKVWGIRNKESQLDLSHLPPQDVTCQVARFTLQPFRCGQGAGDCGEGQRAYAAWIPWSCCDSNKSHQLPQRFLSQTIKGRNNIYILYLYTESSFAQWQHASYIMIISSCSWILKGIVAKRLERLGAAIDNVSAESNEALVCWLQQHQ